MVDDPTRKIREMIADFRIPQSDALEECLLFDRSEHRSVIDAGIFISTRQSDRYYSDIFQFWVRAFFCFVEDLWLGGFFDLAAAWVDCRQITSEEFRTAYLELIHSRTPDERFAEIQVNPKLRIELENRTFFEAYVVLDRPNIRSAVAASDGEYVAYFQTVPRANN